MLANIVSSLGLVLNIVGVVLVWQFGLPAAISRAGYIITDRVDEEEKGKGRRYELSGIHIGLLTARFTTVRTLLNFGSTLTFGDARASRPKACIRSP